ncbi:MAG TPA: metalloregulator ArsR/SmtB family transcription factor [Devosia sp.]|jgi:DNA-binding transcriptional ArsR family regulator|nr:metalloregulator ArsR/SmtB family transcription factor [Devosia sp.]
MPPIAILVALADPTRCRIIELLREGPLPVHVLAMGFDISRPAISRHLRVLKQARLISEKKVGRENRYALHAGRLRPVRAWVDAMSPASAGPERRANGGSTLDREAAASPHKIPVMKAVPPKLPAQPPLLQMGFEF